MCGWAAKAAATPCSRCNIVHSPDQHLLARVVQGMLGWHVLLCSWRQWLPTDRVGFRLGRQPLNHGVLLAQPSVAGPAPVPCAAACSSMAVQHVQPVYCCGCCLLPDRVRHCQCGPSCLVSNLTIRATQSAPCFAAFLRARLAAALLFLLGAAACSSSACKVNAVILLHAVSIRPDTVGAVSTAYEALCL